MQLDDWIALSPDFRREREERWRNFVSAGQQQAPEETEWSSLIHEAADRFARQYGHMPEVLCVGGSCLFDDIQLIAIGVRTRLSAGRTLAGLPVEYATFSVKQEPVGEDIQSFKDTWSAVLSRLFGWDQPAIADFIVGQEWVWRSFWFLHDPPCENLPTQVLARSALHSVRGYDEFDFGRIGEELVRAIGGRFYIHQEPDYDWEAAERRIARILEKYDRP